MILWQSFAGCKQKKAIDKCIAFRKQRRKAPMEIILKLI